MIKHQEKKDFDFYSPNCDFIKRKLDHNHEIVDYQNGSTIRIWYNEQKEGYENHWHTSMEIIIPVENYYEVKIGNYIYHINPGEIFIIPPGELHQLISPGSGKRFIFLFDINNITKLQGFVNIQTALTKPLHLTKISYSKMYDIEYTLLMQMCNEYFSKSDFRELVIYSLLIQFFVNIGRNRLANDVCFKNIRMHKQKEYIKIFSDILDYIDIHYAEKLSLEAIAKSTGFSKYHFARLFKEYTNTTFYDYLIYKRIKVVEELLANPDLSITDIALLSGFSSISTFNRIFRKIKNCTPTEYRFTFSVMHCKM